MDSTRKKARVRRAETGGVRSRHKPKPALSSKHRRVQVSFPQSFHPIVVLSPPRARRRKRKPRDRHVARPQPAGCIFATVNPTSVVTVPGGRTICEYSVPGDANPADSVTFNGGPKITSISLVPIFYGSAWLTSAPSNLDVMAAMQRVLQGPYLSELGQYGFVSLDVKPPVLKADPSPPAGHSADSVGDIVWDLIDNDVFPEPDDPGGYNIYMVFYPPGTAISDLNACGWHSRYWDYDFPFDLDWAWVGAVDFPTGGANTTVTLNNIIRVFSHELVEMITDPEASGGWAMDRSINGGDEIGDACNNTVDFVNGTLVNAYWSERHKACIIPKPTGFIVIDLKESTLASQSVASGVAQINLLFCLRNQSYHWDILFQDEQVVFSANAPNARQRLQRCGDARGPDMVRGCERRLAQHERLYHQRLGRRKPADHPELESRQPLQFPGQPPGLRIRGRLYREHNHPATCHQRNAEVRGCVLHGPQGLPGSPQQAHSPGDPAPASNQSR